MSTSVTTTVRPGRRGTVVMLVDNPVENDSRVQKEARSMAEHGWDVTLLGRRPASASTTSWMLGDATVRLVPVPTPLNPRRHEYASPILRSPAAYRSPQRAAYRKQQVRAHLADLRFRIAAARVRRGSVSVQPLRAALLRRKIELRWVAWRHRRTTRLREARVSMTRPVDRFTTWWWRTVMGNRCWRRLDPNLWDWELAYGPVIDRLAPDLVHANDFRMLSVGARAVTRARAKGRTMSLVWDAHEYLPGIKPWNPHPRWHAAQCALEREFAPRADAVVTVAGSMAEALVAEHGLARTPDVVLNAPSVSAPGDDGSGPDIRSACGLATDVPLLVYSGVPAPQRGLDIMVEALVHLPDTHVAFVVPSETSDRVRALVARAEELEARDRLHVLGYVPVDDIVLFLSTATVGVMPAHHWPNHELTLATKLFEYSHARLPVVMSDLRAMADTVRDTGQGEVFVAEDLADYVRAVRAVLDDPAKYRAAYRDKSLLQAWTWEAQAGVLDRVYAELVDGRGRGRVKPPHGTISGAQASS